MNEASRRRRRTGGWGHLLAILKEDRLERDVCHAMPRVSEMHASYLQAGQVRGSGQGAVRARAVMSAQYLLQGAGHSRTACMTDVSAASFILRCLYLRGWPPLPFSHPVPAPAATAKKQSNGTDNRRPARSLRWLRNQNLELHSVCSVIFNLYRLE